MDERKEFDVELVADVFKPPIDYVVWLDKQRAAGDMRDGREMMIDYSTSKIRRGILTTLSMKAKAQMWADKSKSHTVVLNRYTLGEHFDIFHQLTTTQMVGLLEHIDSDKYHIVLRTRRFKLRNTFTITFHKMN